MNPEDFSASYMTDKLLTIHRLTPRRGETHNHPQVTVRPSDV